MKDLMMIYYVESIYYYKILRFVFAKGFVNFKDGKGQHLFFVNERKLNRVQNYKRCLFDIIHWQKHIHVTMCMCSYMNVCMCMGTHIS